MDQVKLVIWDLDETFWHGTLAEGEIEWDEENIELVRELTDRGIINTIVSKNKFEDVKAKLSEKGIWDYFVFPVISYNPKGESIRNLLSKMKLRSKNAVFVDDNIANLKEAEFYNEGLIVKTPDEFDKSILCLEEFKGKIDVEHSRLHQYKNLEKRSADEEKAVSNIDFLRNSNIQISVCSDCVSQLERIYELIQRTNQLNYTKERITKDELKDILSNDAYESAYIRVKDKYGDYGIVGFYSLYGRQLVHFLFSCRTLGLGIEKYIYRKLNYPLLAIKGEVATDLENCENIDWIQESVIKDNESSEKRKRNILMIGGCDLSQAAYYLKTDYCVMQEFNTVDHGIGYRSSDSWQLLASKRFSQEQKKYLCDAYPFYNMEVTFGTSLFSAKYDCIIYSVVDDYIRAMFRHKKWGIKVGLGAYFDCDSFFKRYDPKAVERFKEEFEFEGKLSTSEFRKNLEDIIEATNSKIILINGNEIDISDKIGEERIQRQIEMNKVVDEVVKKYAKVKLLDMRKVVTDCSELTDDNRHYRRKVYFKMAQNIAQILDSDSYFNVSILNTIGNKIKNILKTKK